MQVKSTIWGACALLALTATAIPVVAQAQRPSSTQQTSVQTKESFTEARFLELQKTGALILVDIWAEWCPTCAQQQKVLTAFRAENPNVPFHTLTVDFDRQKEWVKKFAAPRQSTLILYRGEKQIWFSVAETRADRITSQILAAAGS